jgi:hypothetical protein
VLSGGETLIVVMAVGALFAVSAAAGLGILVRMLRRGRSSRVGSGDRPGDRSRPTG